MGAKHGRIVYHPRKDFLMPSGFRKIVLHSVVGSPQDFRPRAIFMPEVLLGHDPVCRASLDRILPHPSDWGGWPGRLYEALLRSGSPFAHLILTLPMVEPRKEGKTPAWGFIPPLKRDLVSVRARLMEIGVEEILPGALMVREELTAIPEGEDRDLPRDRLETLGFRRRYVFSERTEGDPAPPFERLHPPCGEEEDGSERWASSLISACGLAGVV